MIEARCFRSATHYTIVTLNSAVPLNMLQLAEFNDLLPPRSPNLNAFAERWVRSTKHECLSKLVLFGEASLRRALTEFVRHYHHERNHQGKDNLLLFPAPASPPSRPNSAVTCHRTVGWFAQVLPTGRIRCLTLRARKAVVSTHPMNDIGSPLRWHE